MNSLFQLCSSEIRPGQECAALQQFSLLSKEISEDQSKLAPPKHRLKEQKPLGNPIDALLAWIREKDPDSFISPSLLIRKADESVGYSVFAKSHINASFNNLLE